jgi:predicted MFS family arabinose efflux permease
LRGIPVLFALVFSAALTSMFGIAFQTLLLIFLVDSFGLSAPRIGLLLAAGGAGAVCGSLLSGRMVRAIGVGRSIVTAQALFGVMGMILPLALIVPERIAPGVIAISLFTQLAFNTVREVNGAALSQAVISPEVLGRTQSTSLVLIKTFEVAGSLAAGGLALAFGTSVAIVLLLIGMLLSIAPMIGSDIPAIVTLDEIDASA